MKIVLFGVQMATGGAQKVLLDQARWFYAHGHEVCVVFFYDREGLFEKWRAILSCPVVILFGYQRSAGLLVNSFKMLIGLFHLWRLLSRERFDVIEAFTPDGNLIALPLAWLLRIPVRIATHHGMIENLPRWRTVMHAFLINSGIASVLVAVSRRTKKRALYEGVDPDRIVVIQNGVELVNLSLINRSEARAEAGTGGDDLFLMSVGRLAYQKAHEILVQSMPAVLKEYPNVKLGIFGDGFLRSQLESQIRIMGLANSIRIFGIREDIDRFLVAADVFVLPSRWEGLPIALLEAMSAGLPVVATAVEGVDEVVVQGEQGLLVPTEDSAALAEAMLKLLGNPELRQRMGNSARRRIEQGYTIERMCLRYLDIMLNMMPTDKKK
jgi:glycosyltransferase involved in cell wall biosynthesis